MRVNRLGRYRRKRRYRSILNWMFFIILPVGAMIVALCMSGTLKNTALNVMKSSDGGKPAAVDTFNRVLNIEGKDFYRIEFKSFEELDAAEKYVKTLKASKLNAFIVKESGFKVVFGIFYSSENASEVSGMLSSGKKENGITPISLGGVSFKYGDEDNTFVETIKASDRLMDDILKAKSQLSVEYALKNYDNYEDKLGAIAANEGKLAQYLENVKQFTVSDNLKVFKEQYIKLLMDFKQSGIEPDTVKKDYYKLQNSMLLQVKSYRDFIERLSV